MKTTTYLTQAGFFRYFTRGSYYALAYSLLSLLLAGCASDDNYTAVTTDLDTELEAQIIQVTPGTTLDGLILPASNDFDKIPQDPRNPLNTEKVLLGKLLMHETATGGNPKVKSNLFTYSCASCHAVAASFGAGIVQGIGEGGMGFGVHGEGRVPMPNSMMPRDSIDVQPVKSISLLNGAYTEVALWNGSLGAKGINAPFVLPNAETIPSNLHGFSGLETQGIAGQETHRLKIDEDFVNAFGYKSLFDAAFPEIPESERYTDITASLALAAYERTLLTNQAPWQQWLKGDKSAMTDKEKRGALVFFSTGKCYQCHKGPALREDNFYAWAFGNFTESETILAQNLRSFNLPAFLGRGGFTGNVNDYFKFKVPTLYNLKENAFYGHGGSFRSIREVVEYKASGLKQNKEVPNINLAPQFGSIALSEEEIDDLTAFLSEALYDNNLERYVPEAVYSGNCFPNNDEMSQIDLGCINTP